MGEKQNPAALSQPRDKQWLDTNPPPHPPSHHAAPCCPRPGHLFIQ